MTTGARLWLWMREQFAFLIVVVVLAAAFLYLVAAPGRWSRSTGLIAVAALLAGLLRAALPTPRVGLLAIRGRVSDAICFLVLGGVLLGVDIRLHG